MQVLHVCSEMFPLLKTAVWRRHRRTARRRKSRRVSIRACCCRRFPISVAAWVDAQVVTRRDTFAGRITLLYGHFNGVGIYLIDARISMTVRGALTTIPTSTLIRQRPALCLLGWVGSEMASGLDPFWRPGCGACP
ncbi:Glycogen synthase, ADP-glucose transglucosylase [Klebsiella aerogenes]|nr:Glycogen synthase, ADP-glucose transglucosylase [Klebsiella aerogenes]